MLPSIVCASGRGECAEHLRFERPLGATCAPSTELLLLLRTFLRFEGEGIFGSKCKLGWKFDRSRRGQGRRSWRGAHHTWPTKYLTAYSSWFKDTHGETPCVCSYLSDLE